MSAEERSFLERRAEEEVERAQRSADPKVVRFHYLLMEAYLERLYGQSEPSARP
jgi:hypothetical protein